MPAAGLTRFLRSELCAWRQINSRESRLYELELQRDFDLVPDHESARLERYMDVPAVGLEVEKAAEVLQGISRVCGGIRATRSAMASRLRAIGRKSPCAITRRMCSSGLALSQIVWVRRRSSA